MRIKVGNLYFGLKNDGFANVVGIDRENYSFLEEELIIPDKVEYKDRNYIVNSILSTWQLLVNCNYCFF